MNRRTKFVELKELFNTLHGPKGCLWDKSQTHKTLLKYLKEETQEFVDATRKGNIHHMKEELGDILLQVMFHSQIAKKEGNFDVEEVIDGLIKKLRRRHPHVFAGVKVNSAHEITRNWHRIKRIEKKGSAS
jgi:tetrapyrrole methylase family protein/MazG family protein